MTLPDSLMMSGQSEVGVNPESWLHHSYSIHLGVNNTMFHPVCETFFFTSVL